MFRNWHPVVRVWVWCVFEHKESAHWSEIGLRFSIVLHCFAEFSRVLCMSVCVFCGVFFYFCLIFMPMPKSVKKCISFCDFKLSSQCFIEMEFFELHVMVENPPFWKQIRWLQNFFAMHACDSSTIGQCELCNGLLENKLGSKCFTCCTWDCGRLSAALQSSCSRHRLHGQQCRVSPTAATSLT